MLLCFMCYYLVHIRAACHNPPCPILLVHVLSGGKYAVLDTFLRPEDYLQFSCLISRQTGTNMVMKIEIADFSSAGRILLHP